MIQFYVFQTFFRVFNRKAILPQEPRKRDDKIQIFFAEFVSAIRLFKAFKIFVEFFFQQIGEKYAVYDTFDTRVL